MTNQSQQAALMAAEADTIEDAEIVQLTAGELRDIYARIAAVSRRANAAFRLASDAGPADPGAFTE